MITVRPVFLQAMEIVLSEITFTALLGSVILLTLTCANLVKSRGRQRRDDATEGGGGDPVASGAGGEDKAAAAEEEKEEKNKVFSQSGLKYRRASSAPTQRKVG